MNKNKISIFTKTRHRFMHKINICLSIPGFVCWEWFVVIFYLTSVRSDFPRHLCREVDQKAFICTKSGQLLQLPMNIDLISLPIPIINFEPNFRAHADLSSQFCRAPNCVVWQVIPSESGHFFFLNFVFRQILRSRRVIKSGERAPPTRAYWSGISHFKSAGSCCRA